MALLLDILSWAALMAGSLFVLAGSIGILRMPNFFTRLHPAGVTDTLGTGLILLGLFFQAGLSMASIKLVLIFLFMMVTGPTASHALAKAALHGGVRMESPRHETGDSPSNT